MFKLFEHFIGGVDLVEKVGQLVCEFVPCA